VKRVVDGDTLLLENRKYVRLLGIDTPEMHESAKLHRDALRSKQSVEAIQQSGRQAYELTKQLVEGKRVRLEFDWQRYDKYNRILAYVFLEDGTLVNARIVEEGYASLTNFRINVTYADLFLKLYREARENKRGLWAGG
jgi:micrococcal nuclease